MYDFNGRIQICIPGPWCRRLYKLIFRKCTLFLRPGRCMIFVDVFKYTTRRLDDSMIG